MNIALSFLCLQVLGNWEFQTLAMFAAFLYRLPVALNIISTGKLVVCIIYYVSTYHHIDFVEVIKLRTSTSKTLAISFNCSIDGCTLLAHHLETVFSDLPSCSDSQRFVLPCSAKAAFSRFSIIFC